MKDFLLSGWFWYPLIITAFALCIVSLGARAQTDDTVRVPRRIDTTNIAGASAQEVFDWVVFNLRVQGKRSENAAGTCVYRGEDGCKCAAGFLIADQHYDPCFEGTGWHYLQEVLPPGAQDNRHIRLVEALQVAHDTYSFNREIENNVWDFLGDIAKEHKLSPAILNAPI